MSTVGDGHPSKVRAIYSAGKAEGNKQISNEKRHKCETQSIGVPAIPKLRSFQPDTRPPRVKDF